MTCACRQEVWHGRVATHGPKGKIVLQTCKHISFALIGLLFPCAITVALRSRTWIQMMQVAALINTTMLQLTMQLTTAVPRERMQCSILYYLLKSVRYVNSTLEQAHGSTKFLILFCDGLMLCLSIGVDVLGTTLYERNGSDMHCRANDRSTHSTPHVQICKSSDACDIEQPTHTATQI